ncbi:hypothetical protein G6F66_008890 [Rhizopus arrhizus]|nr:hypothetical protein G6F66_008890 [Rhizopus arrhizus]
MPNKIKLLYFAGIKDITGKDSEEIQMQQEDYNLQNLSTDLTLKYGEKLKMLLETSMYAVDMQYVEKEKEPKTFLRNNTEVAIIPPVSGGVAALVARFITFPLDTIKVRLQTDSGGHQYSRLLKDGETENFFEKAVSLYQGLAITLVFSIPALTTYLIVYTSVKVFLGSLALPILREDALLNHAISGLCAESSAGLFFTPMEVLKSQLQVDTRHQSTLTLAAHIIKEEGILGFYKGYFITLSVFVPHSVVYFILYEKLKSTWDVQHQTFLVYIFCAAIASAAGMVVSTPLDIIKTRWQVSRQEEAYRGGPVKIALRIWNEGGLSIFVRSMLASIVWGVPLTTINMAVFECLLKLHRPH